MAGPGWCFVPMSRQASVGAPSSHVPTPSDSTFPGTLLRRCRDPHDRHWAGGGTVRDTLVRCRRTARAAWSGGRRRRTSRGGGGVFRNADHGLSLRGHGGPLRAPPQRRGRLRERGSRWSSLRRRHDPRRHQVSRDAGSCSRRSGAGDGSGDPGSVGDARRCRAGRRPHDPCGLPAGRCTWCAHPRRALPRAVDRRRLPRWRTGRTGTDAGGLHRTRCGAGHLRRLGRGSLRLDTGRIGWRTLHAKRDRAPRTSTTRSRWSESSRRSTTTGRTTGSFPSGRSTDCSQIPAPSNTPRRRCTANRACSCRDRLPTHPAVRNPNYSHPDGHCGDGLGRAGR